MQKTFNGKIISLKMNRTAVIEVTRKRPHPLYKKVIKRESNYKADKIQVHPPWLLNEN